jgi:N-glycosylase/DNA lyase
VTEFRLEVAADELDLAHCFASGQVFRWARRGAVWEGTVGGNWFQIEREDEIHMCARSSADEEAVRRLFRLEVSANEIRDRAVGSEPELHPVFERLAGLRVLRQGDAEETLFTFLCTPNNHLIRIRRMVEALARFGEQLPDAPFPAWRFPAPERIALISEDELRGLGFGYRSRTIPAAARAVLARGAGWVESLKQAGYQAAHEELAALPGIGPKLADCVCLFGLDFLEAVPVDTHVWQVACRRYFPEWAGRSLTANRYRRIGDLFRDRFGEWAGWVHQYLFYENLLHGESASCPEALGSQQAGRITRFPRER